MHCQNLALSTRTLKQMKLTEIHLIGKILGLASKSIF